MAKIFPRFTDVCGGGRPEGFDEWARGEIIANNKVILFETGGRHGWCSACGNRIHAHIPGHRKRYWNNTTIPEVDRWRDYGLGREKYYCPMCEAECAAYHESNADFGERVCKVVFAVKGSDNSLWFRVFDLIRDRAREYRVLGEWLDETERIYLGQGTAKRWFLAGGVKKRWNRATRGCWTEDHIASNALLPRNTCYELYRGNFGGGLFDGTTLQYADFAEASAIYDPLDFAVTFARFPAVEQLRKHGLEQLVKEKLTFCYYNYSGRRADGGSKSVNWRAKRGKDLFKFPHWVLRTFEPAQWNGARADAAAALWACEILTDGERAAALKAELDKFSLEKALGIARTYGVKPPRLLKYINGGAGRNITDYADYLRECAVLGFDLSLKRIRFPGDLRAAHRETSELAQKKKNEAKAADFKKAVGAYKRLEWRRGGLMIIAPPDMASLKNEGAKLRHCVGGYIDGVASGEKTIFFIRKTDAPEEPYFTLEYSGGEVVQCRTRNNAGYETDEQVSAFVRDWIGQISKLSKKGARECMKR
jgi:hypothetical protein